MTTPRTILFALAAALALGGCGWQSDGLERLEELYPTPEAPPADPCALPDDADAAAVPFSGTCSGLAGGRWAARLVQFGKMSPAGSPWNLTLTDHFLAAPSAEGKALELTFCAQTSRLAAEDGTPINMGKTTMPAATRQAIGQVPLVFPLAADGSLAALQVGWLWGVKGLANPIADPLPTDAGDAHVWDQDGDGKPGVTVEVQSPTGERYMARRSVFDLGAGTLSADGRWLTGSLAAAVTENALGASSAMLKTVAPITPRPECKSLYQLRCVDASFTCDQVIAGAGALFRDAPK